METRTAALNLGSLFWGQHGSIGVKPSPLAHLPEWSREKFSCIGQVLRCGQESATSSLFRVERHSHRTTRYAIQVAFFNFYGALARGASCTLGYADFSRKIFRLKPVPYILEKKPPHKCDGNS